MSFFVLTFVLLVALAHISHSWSFSTTTKEYKLVPAEYRNVLFVGRSRAGKSVLIEVLKDALHSPSLSTILRGTVDASVESFTMTTGSGKDIHFNIMDTPGLFERTNEGDQRTNNVILGVIKKCIDMEITKINHVYFVMSVQNGLNPEDVLAFNLFTQLFVGMESKISIILSFTQMLSSEEDYDHYLDQFRTVKELRPLWEKIQGRIFFLGAAQDNRLVQIELLQNNVKKQRDALFEHLIAESESFNVKTLKVYKDNLSFLKELRRTFDDCCKSTKTCEQKRKFDIFLEHYMPNDDIVTKEKNEL